MPTPPPDEDTQLLPTRSDSASTPSSRAKVTLLQFLVSFFPLSLISFGGPQAHVALMHARYVDKPLSNPSLPLPYVPEALFLELYALAQSLPGPGSTQLAVSLGATFGGVTGAAATFLIWHLPGFVVMTCAGVWFHRHLQQDNSAVISRIAQLSTGLIAAALSFVLVAAYKIIGKTCAGGMKMGIALVCMFVAVTIPPQRSAWVFILLLVLGGVVYYVYHMRYVSSTAEDAAQAPDWQANVGTTTGAILVVLVAVGTGMIALLPSSNVGFRALQIFWRIGLTVFGGGVVVIPMLLNEVVESGLLPSSVFLFGFGLFGCTPGPMFNIAPFLGAAMVGYKGALFGSLGIFAPGVLLQIGLLPYWERLRGVQSAQVFLQGTNCAAAGLILAGVWMLVKRALVGGTAFAIVCSAGAMNVVYGLSPAKNMLLHGALGAILVVLQVGGPFER